ncbi:alpha/beta hydrolase family protein [Parvularcula oceani]|uniref:S9 family peptidase n=1 Tax=Parvularcula oceani TaxID=1247963 RepID=UPI00056A00B7|nr:S9 family peptidase [Parvularcula oceani]
MKHSLALLAATALTAAPAFAQEPMEIDDLFKVRAVGDIAVSPDGGSVAYALHRMPDILSGEENGTALTQWRVARGPGSDRLYVSEETGAGSVSFLDDETLLYLAEGPDGARALWQLPLAGGAAEPFFAFGEDIRGYALSEDGQTLFFTAQDAADPVRDALEGRGFDANVIDEDLSYTRLYRVDLGAEAPEARRVEVDGQVSAIAVSPDGSLVAVALAPSPTVADDIINRRIRVLDGRSGELVQEIETEGKIGSFAFSPDGGTLGFLAGTSRYDSVAHTIGVADLMSGEMRFLTGEDEADEIDFVWTGEDEMRVLVHEGTGSATYTLSAEGEISDRQAHDGFVVSNIEGGANGTVATASSPEEPSALFGGETLTQWTDHNAWLDGVELYPQRVVRYEAEDGTEVEGILIEPATERRRFRRGETASPMITVVHGGPESHYVNGWLTGYSTPGQIAAGDGYAVFYPNYRGSTGRGQAFAALDQENPPAAEFDDIVDGVDYLAEEANIDPERVGITGGSYGGYASAWGATALTEHFGAAVVFVALTDLTSFMGTTDIPEEMVDSHFRVTPEEAPEIYREQSPVNHAADSTTPTLILHGEADPRVHPSQSLQLFRTMKRLSDAPVRLVTYPGEGHGNRRAAAQYDYANRMMRWFDTYLKTGERDAAMPARELEAVRRLEAEPSSAD